MVLGAAVLGYLKPARSLSGFHEDVRADEMADLSLGAIKISPAFPSEGETVEVALEVANHRRFSAAGVSLIVYDGQERIASRTLDLPPVSTTAVRLPWLAAGAGLHILSASVNSGRRLPELNTNDNYVAEEVAVSEPPSPGDDLAVTNVQVVNSPEGVMAVRATVQNRGRRVLNVPLMFRDARGGATVRMTGLVQTHESVAVAVPMDEESARSIVSVEVNPRNKTQEENAADNVFAIQHLVPKAADLSVEGVTGFAFRDGLQQIRSVTFAFRVVNAGNLDITTPFRTVVSLSPAISQPFSVVTSSLPAGEAVYVSRTFNVGVPILEFKVAADVDGVVPELLKTNNTAEWRYEASVQPGRWANIGPTRMNNWKAQGDPLDDSTGLLSAIAIDPSAPWIIYVGSARGAGVWKTTDGGASWRIITESLPTLSTAAIAVDPSDSQKVYLATPAGIFRSADGGGVWIRANNNVRTDGQALNPMAWGGVLLVDPKRPETLYLATAEGVCRSTDHGATWSLSKSGGATSSLVMDPGNPDTLYAAIGNETNLGNTGIYETTTGGAKWEKLTGASGGWLPSITTPAWITLALSGGTLYAGYHDGKALRVYRTTEVVAKAGTHYEKLWEPRWDSAAAHNDDPLNAGLTANPADPRYVYVSGTYLFISEDGGKNFSRSSGAHDDFHGFATDPRYPSVFYTVGDGGIYRSSNYGRSNTWQFTGDGIADVEFYDLTHAATKPSRIMGGTQDNGTALSDSTSTVWRVVNGGDGATVAIDPKNAGLGYCMYQTPDSLARINLPSGTGRTPISQGLPAGHDYMNFQWFPIPGNRLLACAHELWLRDFNPSGGNAWGTVFTPPSGNVVWSAMDEATGIIYAGTDDGKIHGIILDKIGTPAMFMHPAAMPINDIEVDRNDPATIYAAFKGVGAKRIIRLRRLAPMPGPLNELDITSDLPQGIGVNCLAVDRLNPLTIYAGTDRAGVYRGSSRDAGLTWHWSPYNNGLHAAAAITDLEVHAGTGILRAATFGRSAYEVNTDWPIGSAMSATGRPVWLRVQDIGTGFGPPNDFLDAEVLTQLDTQPGKFFGFQLRGDSAEGAHQGMLSQLQTAFRKNGTVRLDYVRTGPKSGRIVRVENLNQP
jgi:photosystem II stability/assembly factor-like uncharacterized protein